MRNAVGSCAVAPALLAALLVLPRPAAAQPLTLLDVPFISQSEALCGGAAAAMVLRFWGERGLTADSFAALVDRSEAGIRTNVLVDDLRRRGFDARPVVDDTRLIREELTAGRPVIALIEDRPRTFHYVVLVGWHERGIILHDPARAPFQVMAPTEFDRRWSKADRWSLVIPGGRAGSDAGNRPSEAPAARPAALPVGETGACEARIAEGVRLAGANDLAGAERTLMLALPCPGGAAMRELAGLRLLQRRFAEVDVLASAAVAQDPADAYAWKLLGTARFVRNDTITALDAWNRAGEPRVDLIRVDGLVRTRQRVVERLVGVSTGELLTAALLRRAQRQIAELPSAATASIRYVPAPGGLVQINAAIVERAAFPGGIGIMAATAVSAAAKREVTASFSSLSGGGERLSVGWRFWPGRPRYSLEARAPGPFGGVWSAAAAFERQPFTGDALLESRRETAEGSWSRWTARGLRLEMAGGLDRWRNRGVFGLVGGGVATRSRDDRVDVQAGARTWLGDARFASWQLSAEARTSSTRDGFVALVRVTAEGVTHDAPFDLWPAGDTGLARPVLMRSHPLVDDGRLRAERLGRAVVSSSLEAQHWHRFGPIDAAPAAFIDLGRTAMRVSGPPLMDVDAGVGVRVAPLGFPGMLRLDVAKGLRDGSTALSVVYER